jgi:hypothetical protein
MNLIEKSEKKRLIGEHIRVNGSRLRDNEVEFLYQFVTKYNRFIRIADTIKTSQTGWDSDGKYTRWKEYAYSFRRSHLGVYVEESYRDDDGQSGSYPKFIDDARGVINWFREHKHLKPFDAVRDICDLI